MSAVTWAKSGSVSRVYALAVALVAPGAGGCDPGEPPPEIIDAEPEGEGVAFDEHNPRGDLHGKEDAPPTYEVPDDLPELERPEIIVSLATKTVHLFDRATGFSAVYPAGPGVLGSSGRSITPTGFFTSGPDPDDAWYYVERRYAPDYFGGFPFLRLTALNSKGQHTYGLHGPITYTCPSGGSSCSLTERQWFLVQDYVSHGCVRMEAEDVVELFWSVREHASIPVTIIGGEELDAAGRAVDLGTDVALWPEGAAIEYAECGPRPDPWQTPRRWASDDC
jgi:hypothetical protein